VRSWRLPAIPPAKCLAIWMSWVRNFSSRRMRVVSKDIDRMPWQNLTSCRIDPNGRIIRREYQTRAPGKTARRLPILPLLENDVMRCPRSQPPRPRRSVGVVVTASWHGNSVPNRVNTRAQVVRGSSPTSQRPVPPPGGCSGCGGGTELTTGSEFSLSGPNGECPKISVRGSSDSSLRSLRPSAIRPNK
jgi:hypothetical protein